MDQAPQPAADPAIPPPPPATLWRRLAAAGYDGLLLLALWFLVLFLDKVAQDLLGLPDSVSGRRALLLLTGLGFNGWFWINGGQTLGMRAWRLHVRTRTGGPLTWPIAALRYAVAFLSWSLAGLGMLWCLLDRRRRSWHDLAAGTEVVLLPRPLSAPAAGAAAPSPPG